METKPFRVLLVEDNPGDARLLREILADAWTARFELTHVDVLREALDRLSTVGFDVVLLDLSLPDGHGIETILRVAGRAPDVPIVVLTGLNDEKLALTAVQEGAQDYLVKGQVDGNLLVRSIRYAIERKRAEEERANFIREQAARAEAEATAQQLRRVNQQLVLATVQAQEMAERAKAAIRVRDDVLASVSHDLKTPLVSIKGFAQLLQRRLAQASVPDLEWMAEGLARIDTSATKMATLINELLDVAHIQIGQPLELHRQPFDLVTLVRQVVGEHQRGTDRHCVRVEASVEKLVGRWDALRLERVLANLLVNAIKFSPNGGDVVVGVDRADVTDGSWAVLTVRDRGIGIPDADLPRVFERFHRGTNVIGEIAGTGIGLAAARQIVEQHSGTIEVLSKEGGGSIFTVRLPL